MVRTVTPAQMRRLLRKYAPTSKIGKNVDMLVRIFMNEATPLRPESPCMHGLCRDAPCISLE